MPRSWAFAAILVTGCGGSSSPGPQYATQGPAAIDEPRLEPQVAGQQWYRALSTCAQGPYELEVTGSGATWGEEFELRVATPRKLALHAVILVDDREVETADALFDQRGITSGKPDNARCIADARERLVLGRPSGGTGGGTTGTPGTLVVPPPDRPKVTAQLELDTTLVTTSTEVVRVSLRERPAGSPPPRIKIRFWSVEPNDLVGVLFGVAQIEWRPNVPADRYEAHLRWKAEQVRIAEQRRIEDQQRRIEEARRAAEEWRRTHPPQVAPPVVVEIDLVAERKREEARLRAEREAEEARRRRAIAAALEVERRLRRQQFCASHHEDRGCWGAGGYAMHAELERHRKEKADYCAAHAEDARCWTSDERARRRAVWNGRIDVALAPPKQPDGPPPQPLAEEQPPKLSANAEWRPGYWQWTAGTWVWLAGMWRVPDEDITNEQTATAPAAPPPVRVETQPSAPVAAAIWVPGFWMWNGTSWIWIAGSWQLRPEPRVTWRAAEWRSRGAVHVLIPGGWVRIGGGR